MRRSPWIWPAIILLSAIAAGMLTFGDSTSPARPFVALWFLCVCPGMAVAPLLQLKERFIEVTLAIALSFAINTIVALTMLYTALWSPKWGLAAVICLSLAGAALQMVAAYRQRLGRVWRPRARS
jgi:uncharacterized membrane protein